MIYKLEEEIRNMNKTKVNDKVLLGFLSHLERVYNIALFVSKDSSRLNKEGMKAVGLLEKGLGIEDLKAVAR